MRNIKYILSLAGVVCAFLTNSTTSYAKEEYIETETLYSYAFEIGKEYDVNPFLLIAMCERESSKNIYAQSKSNPSCKGLMQVSEKWHTDRMEQLGVSNLFDPYENILTATDFIAELYKQSEDTYYVLMRYNMKTSSANELYEQGIITDYALGIVERAEELQEKYQKNIQLENEEKMQNAANNGHLEGGVALWM